MKAKNLIIISINAEKSFDKVRHPLMKKTLSKVEVEGAYLNIIKTIYENPTANIILNGLPLRSGKRQGSVPSPLLFIIVLEVLATETRQKQEIRGIRIGKEEVNQSLFAYNMVV